MCTSTHEDPCILFSGDQGFHSPALTTDTASSAIGTLHDRAENHIQVTKGQHFIDYGKNIYV